MISPKEASIISELFYILDANVRNDLYNNRIADERDYVSRMVTHFNHPFGILNRYLFNHIRFNSKWFAKVNTASQEQMFGCDSMITFRINNEIKVGLFEAKWPRIIKDLNYKWDYTQKSTKGSHFSNQIKRQSKWTNQAAIWEMFFYEEQGNIFSPPFDNNASSCIRHEYAKSMIDSNPSLNTLWNNNDLITLIQSAQTNSFDGTNETNIRQIIYDILICNLGVPISIEEDSRYFNLLSTDNERVVCPVISINGETNIDQDQRIDSFMTENGLSFFQQLDIDILD